MNKTVDHPFERFEAPRAITKGHPLKLLIDERLVCLIAESFAGAWHGFDTDAFVSEASCGLDTLDKAAVPERD